MCDIVLLVYDQAEYSRECIVSILENTQYPFRLIIVDNGSVRTETRQLLDRIQKENPERVRVIRNEINQGYVKAVNRGLSETRAGYVVVMSNDTVVYPGWLTEMVKTAEADECIGIVNPVWECPGSSLDERNGFFKKDVLPRSGEWIETDWARGFCYLTKRSVIDKIGGLDLDFDPAYYDDWDYSMRAVREGYRCARAMGAFVFHYKNVTYAQADVAQNTHSLLARNGKIFYERWGRPLNILWCSMDAASHEMAIRTLLRGQNKMKIVTADRLSIRHTNCRIVHGAPWVVFWAALFDLLDNFRHSRGKRYHVIAADDRMKRFLQMFPGIKKAYEFYDISHGDNGLIARVGHLKFYQTKTA